LHAESHATTQVEDALFLEARYARRWQ